MLYESSKFIVPLVPIGTWTIHFSSTMLKPLAVHRGNTVSHSSYMYFQSVNYVAQFTEIM